jgi:hypothetical protein
MRGSYHYIIVWYMSKIYTLIQTLPRPRLLWWQGVRTHSYDCPPLIKYVKRLLYVRSRSGMSMLGMGGPNHILQHVPQWEPHSESYYPAYPFRVMVWYGVAPLRPPTTYKAWQTLSIGMKRIWYEYTGDGRPQSYPTACPQWEPHLESYYPVPSPPFSSDGMVWCCTLKATHHI